MEVIVFFKNDEKVAEFFCPLSHEYKTAKIFAEYTNEYDTIMLHILGTNIWMKLVYDVQDKNFYNADEPDDWS